MPSHIFNARRDILLPPVSKSRGITLEQKRKEDFELERMYHRESKLRRTGDFKLKNNSHYFENQRRFQLLKR